MKLEESQLKELILEVLSEVSRDPQVDRLRSIMPRSLSDVPMEHRQAMVTFLSDITFKSDKETVKKTLEMLAKHAPNFLSMLD